MWVPMCNIGLHFSKFYKSNVTSFFVYCDMCKVKKNPQILLSPKGNIIQFGMAAKFHM